MKSERQLPAREGRQTQGQSCLVLGQLLWSCSHFPFLFPAMISLLMRTFLFPVSFQLAAVLHLCPVPATSQWLCEFPCMDSIISALTWSRFHNLEIRKSQNMRFRVRTLDKLALSDYVRVIYVDRLFCYWRGGRWYIITSLSFCYSLLLSCSESILYSTMFTSIWSRNVSFNYWQQILLTHWSCHSLLTFGHTWFFSVALLCIFKLYLA